MAGGDWLLALSSETVDARRKLLDCGKASNQWAFVFLGLAVGLVLGVVGTWIHAKQRQWAPCKSVKQQHTGSSSKYNLYGIGLPMMEDSTTAVSPEETEVSIQAQPANQEEVSVLVHSRQSTAPTQTYGTLDDTGKEACNSADVAQYEASAVVVVAKKSINKCDVPLKQTISDEGYAMWLTPPQEASSTSSPMSLCTSAEQQASPPSHPLASTSGLFHSKDVSHANENKAYGSYIFKMSSSTENVQDELRTFYTGPRTTPNVHFGRQGAMHMKGIHESRALAFSLRKFPVDARRITSCPIATLATASPNASVEICLSQ